MDVNGWVRFFDRLLPKSPAWSLVHNGPLRLYFRALSALPNLTRDHIVSVLLELFPAYTSMLHDWSVLFGSTEDYTRDELAAVWAAFGGQDPHFIQTTLRSLGVDVYVHEWWVPGSDPIEARNPIPLVDTSLVLVNDLTTVERNYLHEFGDGTEFGPVAQFGAYDGNFLMRKRYPCPDNPEEYPVYWYVGGETWPDYASIPESKLEKLIQMIFRIKPLHTRCILRVTTYPDRIIQDVVELTAPAYQDVITGDETLQDE